MNEISELSNSMGWVYWQLVLGLSVYFGLLLLEKIVNSFKGFNKKLKSIFGR